MTITLKPEASTILIVEPSKLNCRLLDTDTEATTATKFRHLDNAANLAKVPRWFAVFDQNDRDMWLSEPCLQRRNRVFDCDQTKMPWHNNELVDAIKGENRSRLLICGFWLDAGLAATALEALSDGFDVHVITDLTFSRNLENRRTALRRLEQFGVVPITLADVIFEFMSWSEDPVSVAGMRQILDDPILHQRGASA